MSITTDSYLEFTVGGKTVKVGLSKTINNYTSADFTDDVFNVGAYDAVNNISTYGVEYSVPFNSTRANPQPYCKVKGTYGSYVNFEPNHGDDVVMYTRTVLFIDTASQGTVKFYKGNTTSKIITELNPNDWYLSTNFPVNGLSENDLINTIHAVDNLYFQLKFSLINKKDESIIIDNVHVGRCVIDKDNLAIYNCLSREAFGGNRDARYGIGWTETADFAAAPYFDVVPMQPNSILRLNVNFKDGETTIDISKLYEHTQVENYRFNVFSQQGIPPYYSFYNSSVNYYAVRDILSWSGLYFHFNGEMLKPIISGGVVTGWSRDLNAESEIDNYTNINDHGITPTPTPPTPPTPTGDDDIDDMTLGYDILDNGMIKYYQITVGDLDKVSTVIENMSYAKTIKSVWETLNDTSEPNKLDTILNTLRTWGVSADNLLPSIVSLKSFGISTSNFLAAGGTKAESIVLNGVDCETNTTRILASSMSYHIGDYTIGGKYGDAENPHFLDYAPYTHMEIYIPFCGTVELPSKCMYNTVNVYLLGDIFSGSCVGVVKCKGAIVATKSGMIGVDTPLTSNGNGMKSNALMSGIMNSVGIGAQTILSGATGNMGGIMSGATAGMSNTSQQIQAGNENYTRMIGNVSDKCAWALPHQATIKIVHPIPNYGENYDRTYGKPVCKSRTLTAGDGFTIVDNPIINGNMTLAEKIEIENYLKSGVIL